MAKVRKSWRDKLANSKDLPKVIQLKDEKIKRWGTGSMVIPAPHEVDSLMQQVPTGKLTTIHQLRDQLAKIHKTDHCCPITTGIFSWIAAHAAVEAAAEGAKQFTPYWRTLKSGGELNPKYPGGIKELRQRLESEGHTIVQKGKRFFVAEFEQALTKSFGKKLRSTSQYKSTQK